jgi:hypothetical protein
MATVGVERALVRVTVGEDGAQQVRASYQVSQLAARHLDLELPAPPAGLNLRVRLDQEPVKWKAEGGRVARLEDLSPGLFRKPVVLEVAYQTAPAAADGPARLLATLRAPAVRGDLGRAPLRWLVVLPPDSVPLYQRGGFGTGQRWGWQGWLLAPRPVASAADLERWFLGDTPKAGGEGARGADESAYPYLCAVGVAAGEALRVVHVPRQAWLFGCSVLVLALGLGLYLTGAPRGLFWAAAVVLGLAAAAAALAWPGVLSAVLYGSEPGLLVLALVLGVQWGLNQRYRRQVVFMPGFTRLKPGSSLTRGAGKRPHGEPSTVDEVPPLGGSAARAARGGSSLGRRPAEGA